MDEQIRYEILARAEELPEWERGQFIISETVKAVRAANAQLSDEAIIAEFVAWKSQFSTNMTDQSGGLTRWTRHILTRGGLAGQ